MREWFTDPVTDADDRLLCADLYAVDVPEDGVSEALATGHRVLGTFAELEVGLWDAGPGTDTDVEADEVFVVLRGAGEVRFADGSAIALRPGTLVHLREGDATTWTITERLRKLYLT